MEPAELHELTRHSCAIVVAIEECPALGDGWTLPGVVDQAAEFVKWLHCTRKVPCENFRVFHTGGDDRVFLDLGISKGHIEKAEAGPVYRAFAELETTWPEGKVLFIYWVGHGFVGRDGNRRLILGDAIPAQKRNLDVTQLIQLLRSDLAGGFSQQIAFIDTCARFFETLQSATDLPESGLTRSEYRETGVAQYFFFAASSGEYGTKDLFGSYILKQLENFPPDQWPPDRTWMWPRIEQEFETHLTEAGAKQRPAWLEYREGLDSSTQRGVMPTLQDIQLVSQRTGIPVYQLRKLTELAAKCVNLRKPEIRDQLYGAMGARAVLNRPSGARGDLNLDLLRLVAGVIERGEIDRLAGEITAAESDSDQAFLFRRAAISVERTRAFWRFLAAIQLPLTRARQLYGASYRLRAATDDQPGSLEEIVYLLSSLDRNEPLVEFLLRAAMEREQDPHCHDLNRWLDAQPSWTEELARVRVRLDAEKQGKTRLMVAIEQGSGEGAWQVSRAWLWPAAANFPSELESQESLGNVGSDIYSLLNEVLGRFDTVQLEILVPEALLHLERGFLAWNNRGFRRDPENEHPVVLRWRDRMIAPKRDPRYQSGQWKNTGARFRKRLGSPWRAYWIKNGCDISDFQRQFDKGDAGELIGIPLCSDGASREELVGLICNAGLPFACWPRSTKADFATAEGSVETLLRQHRFDEMPTAVRALRVNDPRALEDILLLWDDPQHNPFDPKFADVGQKVQS